MIYNSIDLINEDFAIGDPIRISCSLGIREGKIVAFRDDRIKIQPFDTTKKPISISADSIQDFEGITEGDAPLQFSKIKECLSPISEVEDDTYETPSETATEMATNSAPVHEYQVGDIVPAEILERSLKERAHRLRKAQMRSEASLSREEQEIAEGEPPTAEELQKQKMPAKGCISNIGQKFGFIKDYDKDANIWFHPGELFGFDYDDLMELKEREVYYQLGENEVGFKATSIMPIGSVADILALVDKAENKRNFELAKRLLKNILVEFPDHYVAKRRLLDLKRLKKMEKEMTRRRPRQTQPDWDNMPPKPEVVDMPEVKEYFATPRTYLGEDEENEINQRLETLFRDGKTEECLEQTQETLNDFQPSNKMLPVFLSRMRRCETALGHHDKALWANVALICYNESNFNFNAKITARQYLDLARTLTQMGRYEDATQALDYSQALAPDQDHLVIDNLRNTIYFKMNQPAASSTLESSTDSETAPA